jgi:NADH dehydrogenase FAD-containing subunit
LVIVMADSVNSPVYEVVILGASYAGLMAALGLAGRNTLSRIALVSESDQFVERIRLQEGVSGPVATRIPPLGVFLSKTKIEFIRGRVESLDPVRHQLEIDIDGQTRSVVFERCIYALGSHIDQDSVRGVAEHAYRLDPGDGLRSVAALRSKLEEYAGRTVRVVVVGGANTATEAAGEIKGTWPEAEVTMISRTRVGDFKKGRRLEQVTRAELKQLGVRLIDGQAISEVRATEVITASGDVIPADICIWAGGLRAASVAKRANLTTDQQDRMWVDATLSSISHPHIIGVGEPSIPSRHPGRPIGWPHLRRSFRTHTPPNASLTKEKGESRGHLATPHTDKASRLVIAASDFSRTQMTGSLTLS